MKSRPIGHKTKREGRSDQDKGSNMENQPDTIHDISERFDDEMFKQLSQHNL
jgi:hypothetical protein